MSTQAWGIRVLASFSACVLGFAWGPHYFRFYVGPFALDLFWGYVDDDDE